MESREIVKRCIEFKDPPRIGRHFRTNPLESNGRVWDISDFGFANYGVDPDFKPESANTTEFGFKRNRISDENHGVTSDPPLFEWEAFDGYKIPDMGKKERYVDLGARVEAMHNQGLYVYGNILAAILHLPSFIRGYENFCADTLLEKDKLKRLIGRLVDENLKIVKRYAEAGMDGVIVWEDWGLSDRAIMGPGLFRELMLPFYRRQCGLIHDGGMHFIHHCCGHVRELIPLFIEGGCDVLQLDQPTINGIDWMGENFGGRICFWNCVDIQTTMQRGTKDEIAEEARRQIRALGDFGGGFMVKAYAQPNGIGLKEWAIEAQNETFIHYGDYPLP